MKTIHFVMQSKGGVGKSFCALMLAQYLLSKGQNIKIADIDPSNQSLIAYRKLGATFVSLLNNDDNVEVGSFDNVCDFIDQTPEDSTIVIDSGSSTFVQCFLFLSRQDITEMWKELGYHLIIHAPIACAEMRDDCIKTLSQMIDNINNTDFVIWINNYPQNVLSSNEQIENLFKEIKNREVIKAVVNIPRQEPSTFGKTLRAVLDKHYLFSQFEEKDNKLELFDRPLTSLDYWRVKKLKQNFFEEISNIDAVI